MKKYRVLTIFLAAMLLVGCGGSSEGKTDSEGTVEASSSETGKASSEDAEAASESTGVTGTATGGSIRDEVINAITMENADAWGICGADLMYLESDDILLIRGTGAGTTSAWTSDDNDNKHTWVIIEEGCTWLDWTYALSFKYVSGKSVSYSVQLLVLPESIDIGTGEEFLGGIGTEYIYYKLANGEVVYADPAYENIDFGDKLQVVSQDEGYSWVKANDDGTYSSVHKNYYDGDMSDSSKSIIENGFIYGTSNDGLINCCQDIPVVEYAGVQYTGEEFGELWSQKLEEYRGYGYIFGD
ncbi:MAG: hypothetical protein LUH19_01210 [Lachnospiraceae bacterium]|nr:hypothetical protein [Lachnospiraceae bacterium]